MQVRQLVGRYAGHVNEMPYHEAQNCLAAGTVGLPEDSPRVKGLNVQPEEPAPVVETVEAEAPVETEAQPETEPEAPASEPSAVSDEDAEAPAPEKHPAPKPKTKGRRKK